MLHSIGVIAGILLMILGLVEVFRALTLQLLRTKGGNRLMMIVPIHGHNEEAELLLRSAATRVKWMDGVRRQRVICLDCGMDDETKEICEAVCRDYGFMEVCSVSEFEHLFGDYADEMMEIYREC
jgi:hypothetical protein